MNNILNGVLAEFQKLAAIPRPSRDERAVAEDLCLRLREKNLKPELDDSNNVICDVPATAGDPAAPRLVLQAHTDMVCVGASDYQPHTDPVVTQCRDGWLCTDGRSSLGADCGIGLAAAMYLVMEEVPHPPLRLIFTADEEEGLAGARKLPADCLKGCCALINLDSFHFGQLLISSAGGCRQAFTKAPECFFPMLQESLYLTIGGLTGGHSGDDIGSDRANAAQLLVWLLQALQMPYELAGISAGNTFNAIPVTGTAHILIDTQDREALLDTADLFLQELRTLYPNEKITISCTKAPAPTRVLTVDERDDLLALAGLIRCGAASPHPLFPGITGSSGSMGMLYADEDRLEVRSFLRSVDAVYNTSFGDFYGSAAEGFGYTVTRDEYPAWPGLEKDWLTDLFIAAGDALGIPQKKSAVHVGLETSIFHALAPDLPMVTVGMDIEGAHSSAERVRLSTIVPFTRLLAAVLKAAAER